MSRKSSMLMCTSCEVNHDDPCFIMHFHNPNRKAKSDTFCVKDGCGARWIKCNSKEAKNLMIEHLHYMVGLDISKIERLFHDKVISVWNNKIAKYQDCNITKKAAHELTEMLSNASDLIKIQ